MSEGSSSHMNVVEHLDGNGCSHSRADRPVNCGRRVPIPTTSAAILTSRTATVAVLWMLTITSTRPPAPLLIVVVSSTGGDPSSMAVLLHGSPPAASTAKWWHHWYPCGVCSTTSPVARPWTACSSSVGGPSRRDAVRAQPAAGTAGVQLRWHTDARDPHSAARSLPRPTLSTQSRHHPGSPSRQTSRRRATAGTMTQSGTTAVRRTSATPRLSSSCRRGKRRAA
mmetsp:Transcript_40892/g.107354  ORF Transcript_40892/g.107354 Transcript_40892/m.107354 type:complete len:225 (-) Transcript_40892:8-682(-)